MATKDISDRQVCEAYAEARRRYDSGATFEFASGVPAAATGQPEKVCYRAMERAYRRGLIECGVSLRSGWLTEAGLALLAAS